MVRSPGGSPTWAMAEAAKGYFVYINNWSRRTVEPYDMAAGALLVRGAGGDVVNIDGAPVDVLNHQGLFVAGVDEDARNRVLEIARHSGY